MDDGADNGRSSSPDIGGWEAGTGHNTVHYTMEYPHKRRRIRERESAAPDAEDTGMPEAATRRASSSCRIDADVVSEFNVDHEARTRTDAWRHLGQGDASET